MNNKKVIGVGVISVILLVLINYLLFNLALSNKIALVEVYVANRNIYPRTEIKETDLKTIKIPKAYLIDKAVKKKSDIIGKYTEIQGMIPKGSLFYQEMLHDKNDLPDYPSLLLKSSQVSFAIQSDVVRSSGNTLTVGQKVDLYVTINRKDGPPIVDCLIKAVRITAIKDRNGLAISDSKSSKIPYVVVIAVEQSQVEYLKVATKIGALDLYGVNTSYQDNEESLLQKDSKVLEYLR